MRKGLLTFYLLACFLKNAELRPWVKSQRYSEPKGCWKSGIGERREAELMPLTYRWFQYELRVYYWVLDKLHGAGRRWNRKPGSTCFLAHGMVWLAGLLQCPAECAPLSGCWQEISLKNQNLMVHAFSDWKRPRPVLGDFIFPVSLCLTTSPLRCSSWETRFVP